MALSALPPIALGFFGLGIGYYVYGGAGFFRHPREVTPEVNKALGAWGIWMPGFMQFVTGMYLFLGLTIFNAFQASPALYMAALAFSSYGIHWFAMGWIKYKGADSTVDGYMDIGFLWISIVGAYIFFRVPDVPVAILFVLLALVYLPSIPANLMKNANMARVKAGVQLITGTWLFYLMFAAASNFALGTSLWL